MGKIKYNFRLRNVTNQNVGLLEAELYDNGHRIYFSTRIYLRPDQWKNGRVTHHPLAREYNIYLLKKRMEYEKLELEMIINGEEPTLIMMKNAIREGTKPSLSIEEFERLVIEPSNRRESTKSSYRSTVRSINEYQRNCVLTDITYSWLIRFEKWLLKKNSPSTINSKMSNLQCLITEACRRELLHKNPFDVYTAPTPTIRKERLSEAEVDKLYALKLSAGERKVRDGFVFCCCCGLRWSDFKSLCNDDIEVIDGVTWIIKETLKTGIVAKIPISKVFDGRACEIMSKYRSLKSFTNIGSNSNTNRILKNVFRQAGIDKYAHWHLSRHTFVSNAIARGVPFATVMIMAGHNKPETTKAYYDDNLEDLLSNI